MNNNTIENLMSPVHNEGHTFIYFAEYDDGGYFYEYDNETNHHKFDDMDKEKVVKFGLIGNKLKLYFDLNSGMFYLNNSSKIKINFTLSDGKEFDLSNESTGQKSLITFKDAHTDAIFTGNMKTANSGNIIDAFNVGMKFKLPEDDIFVTILFVIPVNGENRGRPYFSIRFSSKANQTCDISLEQIYTKDKVEKVYKLMNETVNIEKNKSKSVKICFSK